MQSLFKGSEKLLQCFQRWPSFHDAEVIEFQFWRGDIDKERDRWVDPTLTTKLRVFGHLPGVTDKMVTLRFHDVDELQARDFNHQNVINDLRVITHEKSEAPDSQPPSPLLLVSFIGVFGMSASFKCAGIEVVDVQEWHPETTRSF